MLSTSYRIYIQHGITDCLRLQPPGHGLVGGDGAQLLEWIRNPRNIERLRIGLQNVYEVDYQDLPLSKLKQHGHGKMPAVFRQEWREFSELESGVDMLEAVSNAVETTMIPRVRPRKRSDQPEWLYLLNLDDETLEVYEFQHYGPNTSNPFKRLTIKSLYRKSPKQSPGYYVKLKLSDLKLTRRVQWHSLHKIHADRLDHLWRRNKTLFKTLTHADAIPFAVLYGSVSYKQHGGEVRQSRSKRLTHPELTQIVAAFNRRQPSKTQIF
ncbi:hypothetical protein F4808DRAFT_243143 [Astrocystis sublimbata]|nr:hypothetical protein F4808DRAFT_243143 [Astrocystis sublimbata]